MVVYGSKFLSVQTMLSVAENYDLVAFPHHIMPFRGKTLGKALN